MCLFPANRGYSLDVRRNPALKADSMHSYIKWAVVLQLLIVYTYASIAKLYADWLDFGIIKVLMLNKAEYPIIGAILQEPWIHKIVGVFGIIFDLLIIPALLWKPTRKAAFVASIFFHLFKNWVVNTKSFAPHAINTGSEANWARFSSIFFIMEKLGAFESMGIS